MLFSGKYKAQWRAYIFLNNPPCFPGKIKSEFMTVYDFIKTNFAQHFQKYDRVWGDFLPNGATAISHPPNLMWFYYYVITII